MKQLFHIKQQDEGNGQKRLSVRIGEKHICFAVTGKGGTRLEELAYCSSPEWDATALNTFFATYPSLQQDFYDQHLVYDFPYSQFVPATVDTDRLLPSESFGDTVFTESVPGWPLKMSYAVPAHIRSWVDTKFPAAQSRPQYTLNARLPDAGTDGGNLLVDIREEDFTVLVERAGKILLTRHFPYQVPDDVLFYLLKICQCFSLSQEEVNLSLSGLIEQQSSLYRELYQYFIHVHFRSADWNQEEYPAHFFTSLNDLAKCAS